MARYQHRTFEMFEFYNEAVATLKIRPRATPRIPNALANTFAHLSIKQTGNIVRVTFKQTDLQEEQSTCPFEEDFSRLADLLQNDSRVILDFAGVDQFSAASVETLKYFYRQLKLKGSRLVLCNLESTVKSRFYPTRLPR